MFKIENLTVKVTRGDEGTIPIRVLQADSNGYIKYKNGGTIYWYDLINKKLYDSNYDESDVALNTLEIDYYEFQIGDVITLTVKKVKEFDKEAYVLKKSITLEQATSTVDISLTDEDTKIGELINKPVTYWYDIVLNENQTIIGYDDNGAKEFILYPESGDE